MKIYVPTAIVAAILMMYFAQYFCHAPLKPTSHLILPPSDKDAISLSPHFLDCEAFPEPAYHARRWEKMNRGTYCEAHGNRPISVYDSK